MSSASNHKKQPDGKPASEAGALGGPIEINKPAKPAVPGIDLKRLKEIEQQINENVKQNRPKPSPGRIKIEL
ncbi:MAG: hypothetical protein IGS48_18590 [Oscillatoriales cyanobacterium C42_A2020_001]|nr:hypothetical protein [Leptolyngbyaceae cyanobacterium C42_A2020_001]